MTKLASVTARLNVESIEYINKISSLFHIDKSTAFRKLLEKGIQEDKREKALELYLKGEYSLEKATHFAGMYVGDFLEFMREKGIEKNITLEDFKETLKHAKKL